jgi:hypothetical protein
MLALNINLTNTFFIVNSMVYSRFIFLVSSTSYLLRIFPIYNTVPGFFLSALTDFKIRIKMRHTSVYWPENPPFFAEASLRAEGAVSPILGEEVPGSPRGGRGDSVQPVLVPPRPPLPQAPPGRGCCPWARLHGRCCAHLQRLLHVTCVRVGMLKLKTRAVIFLRLSSLVPPSLPPYYTILLP